MYFESTFRLAVTGSLEELRLDSTSTLIRHSWFGRTNRRPTRIRKLSLSAEEQSVSLSLGDLYSKC